MNKRITRNLLLLIFSASIIIFSCRKNDIQIIIPDNSNPDLVTKVTTTISGFVTNENDEAMSGAIVRVGSAFLNTDQFGYFEIKNVEVNETAATFNVSKNGYFKLTKTFMAKEGKSTFFRIKLTPKTPIGNIDAAIGGDVSLPNGTTISLPADAVKNASTGTSSTGAITISAHYIDPTAADIAGIMPGDLRGLRTNGDLNVLDSYGMLEVELTGASGELLQIADGKKATLTMAIPSSLTATAPATIPLWYFDETTGLWKEEGSANKVGNQYVGVVSHFSTWNCDNPKPHVPYHCRILNEDGTPAINIEVRLFEEGYGGYCNHGYTDSNGEIFGGATANVTVRMEVIGGNACGSVLLRRYFVTTSESVDLGDVTIPQQPNIEGRVSGLVKDCNGNPVSNGRIILSKNGFYECRYLSTNGTYDFISYLCNGSAPVQIFAQDIRNNTQSNATDFLLQIGSNNIPNISACGNVSTLCNQVWMAKNLDVTTYRNGDVIPQVTDASEWLNLTTGAWCWYNNDSTNKSVYGKLYNWYAVNDPRGLAPEGWHIPTAGEWDALINCNGGWYVAGCHLKESGFAHWQAPNAGATNNSGFTGVPGGLRVNDCLGGIPVYYGMGIQSWFVGISSDANSNPVPMFKVLTNTDLTLDNPNLTNIWNCLDERSGVTVRCVKD